MDPFALYPNGTGVRDKSPRLTGLWVDDFEARGVDELTLRRGDKIEVVELDEGFGDGWYLGKHVGTGKTGLFPGGRRRTSFMVADSGWRRKLMRHSLYRGHPEDPRAEAGPSVQGGGFGAPIRNPAGSSSD
jgi:hypothetical protein